MMMEEDKKQYCEWVYYKLNDLTDQLTIVYLKVTPHKTLTSMYKNVSYNRR